MKLNRSFLAPLVLLAIAGLGVAIFFQGKSRSSVAPSALDGRLTLTLPPSWSTMDSLNPVANLKVGDEVADAYLVVVSEKKSEVQGCEAGVQPYSDFVRSRLRDSLQGGREQGPWWVSVGSHRGIRYEISGTSQDGDSLVYLHTVVETPEFFHQVVGWTLSSNYQKNRQALRQISDSLREDGK